MAFAGYDSRLGNELLSNIIDTLTSQLSVNCRWRGVMIWEGGCLKVTFTHGFLGWKVQKEMRDTSVGK